MNTSELQVNIDWNTGAFSIEESDGAETLKEDDEIGQGLREESVHL